MNEPLARIYVSPTQQRAAELFALIADAIQFLGRTAWPIVDLIVRFWIAMPAIVSGLLLANDWNTALMLATSEYPIPWLDPRTEALLGIILQLAGGISLLLGLGTRLGALAIVVLNIATQVYYVSLDLNLFRVALAMGYVFRGPGPLSLDSLLIKGLSRSPIPVAAPLAGFLNQTRAPLSATYLLGLQRAFLGARSRRRSIVALDSVGLSCRALCRIRAVASGSSRPRISHAAHRHSGAMRDRLQRNDAGRRLFHVLDARHGAVAGVGPSGAVTRRYDIKCAETTLSAAQWQARLQPRGLAPRVIWRRVWRHSLRQGAAPYTGASDIDRSA
jgi:uncharacterized membrane protein YphA (DoxX/SURF4 family)